ncbi:MAG: exodeoxyribonuclease VII large subunit [Candidatus Aegiribacteria sp.]|nr:exodeoxyribonuclease VII large subunit [Candidatus Aegiribacteria sp.]
MRPAGITISGYSDCTPDFTVLSLNRRVSEFLTTAFPGPVWVRGELTRTPKVNQRGHTYFQLVEPSPDGMTQPLAVIDCVLFASNRAGVVREFAREGSVFELREGMSLRVQGKVSLWEAGGKYSFIIDSIDPAWTMGNQALLLRKLVDKLTPEGVLTSNSELIMPKAPLKVGLITAEESAASHDFLHGLSTSSFPFKVYAAWAVMQGTDTANSVIRAFNALLSIPDIDVVVLTRGGGSATDLAWFNNEHIARIISQVPWPVISGIGHETDTTLPDFAAFARAKTPTHAADILVNRVADLMRDIESLAVVLHRSASRGVASARERLSGSANILARGAGMILRTQLHELQTLENWLVKHIQNNLSYTSGRLNRSGLSLEKAITAGLSDRRERKVHSLSERLILSFSGKLNTLSMQLDSLDAVITGNNPERLYRRGWTTVRDKNGTLIKTIRSVKIHDDIEILFRDGSINAEAKRVTPERADND